MKYLQLAVLLIFISSCSSTKRIAETTPKETPAIVKVEDSINDTIESIEETIPESIQVSENNEPIKTEDLKEDIIEEPIIEHDTTLEAFSHKKFNNLLKDHVSETGNVNYKNIKKDYNRLRSYISDLGQNTPNETWSREDKLAYWINAYNAFTIDLILRNYPIKSIKDIKDPWDQRLWKLDSKWYNLNDIEHQILRKMDEPRIHFTIVCASISCPKLQNSAFTSENLDNQLTKATKEFLSDSNRNEISKNTIKLSKIFQWFSKDFRQDGNLIDFLNKFSDVTISAKAKKSFKDYNWDLNE